MFEYPKMPTTQGFKHNHCVAFKKYDGSNVGTEWSRKRGFDKFFLRTGLFDESREIFGQAIAAFNQTYAEPLGKILADDKRFRGDRKAYAFMEFFGPSSLAGVHKPSEPKSVVLFDVYKDGFGFLGPDEFLKMFGDLGVAQVIYRGKFTGTLTQDIREGKYADKGVFEGAVIKSGKGGDDIEMAKVKTYAYRDKLQTIFGDRWGQFWE